MTQGPETTRDSCVFVRLLVWVGFINSGRLRESGTRGVFGGPSGCSGPLTVPRLALRLRNPSTPERLLCVDPGAFGRRGVGVRKRSPGRPTVRYLYDQTRTVREKGVVNSSEGPRLSSPSSECRLPLRVEVRREEPVEVHLPR